MTASSRMYDAEEKIHKLKREVNNNQDKILELRAQIRDEEKKFKRARTQRATELRADADALDALSA